MIQMRFTIYKASDNDFCEIREINTLEELINFSKQCKTDLIIGGSPDDFNEDTYPIIIYDDYIE